MTATERRKDADIRSALGLLMEARALLRLHGYSAAAQVIDLAYDLAATDSGVTEYPVGVVLTEPTVASTLTADDLARVVNEAFKRVGVRGL